jgi:hypothetical protein
MNASPVRYGHPDQKMHSKFAVMDGRRVVTGSYNLRRIRGEQERRGISWCSMIVRWRGAYENAVCEKLGMIAKIHERGFAPVLFLFLLLSLRGACRRVAIMVTRDSEAQQVLERLEGSASNMHAAARQQ